MIIYTPEYIPTSALHTVFGLSEEWFASRKDKGILCEGVHFFYPGGKKSRTKKAMVWKIAAIRQFIEGNEVDDELAELLER